MPSFASWYPAPAASLADRAVRGRKQAEQRAESAPPLRKDSEQERRHPAAHPAHEVGVRNEVEGRDQRLASEVLVEFPVTAHDLEELLERGLVLAGHEQVRAELVARAQVGG